MSQTVQFDLFANGSPLGRDLVLHWHRRAKVAGDQEYPDSFDAFTRLWTAFNNWGMRVTEADTDADMIRALAESPPLNKAFAELYADDNKLRTYARTFARFWPIFNVKDLRKKKLRYKYMNLERSEYVKKLLGAHVKHAPRGTFDRDKPTWNATLRTIYQVRCNLIHGEKGDSSEDYHIVEGAYRTNSTCLSSISATNISSW
jgi:hypothetical protein